MGEEIELHSFKAVAMHVKGIQLKTHLKCML